MENRTRRRGQRRATALANSVCRGIGYPAGRVEAQNRQSLRRASSFTAQIFCFGLHQVTAIHASDRPRQKRRIASGANRGRRNCRRTSRFFAGKRSRHGADFQSSSRASRHDCWFQDGILGDGKFLSTRRTTHLFPGRAIRNSDRLVTVGTSPHLRHSYTSFIAIELTFSRLEHRANRGFHRAPNVNLQLRVSGLSNLMLSLSRRTSARCHPRESGRRRAASWIASTDDC